jgi:hypothetical protein
MPLDVSIIPTKQTLPNFAGIADTANALLNLQKSRQALETGGLQLQQLAQQMELNKVSSKAIQENTDENGNVDINSVIKTLSKSPEAANNLAPTITSLLGLKGTQQENLGKQLGLLTSKNTIAGQRLGAMASRIEKGEEITPAEHANEMANLVAEGVFTPDEALLHMRMAPKATGDKEKDKENFHNFIKSEHFATQSNANQLNTLIGQLQPGAAGQPGSVYNQLTQTVTPIQYANPTQPNVSGQAPAPVGAPAVQGTTQAPAQPQVDPIASQLMFPVRQPGTNYALLPNEKENMESGNAYITSMNDRKSKLPTDKRNIEELLSQVQKVKEGTWKVPGTNVVSDVLNKGIRSVSNWAQDPQYQQLSKDIAQMQLSNLKASGGSMSSDKGKELEAYANGTSFYDPEVLFNIAQRTKADLKNMELQTNAANKFAKRYGTNNMNTFKNIWGDVADSKVFQAMNIYESVKDKSEAKKQIDELLGNDPNERKKFHNSYQAIQKLVNTGGL